MQRRHRARVVEREQRAARRGGRAVCTLDVAARRSVADADQRARWISAEALAAAEKKNRPCRGPRADDDA